MRLGSKGRVLFICTVLAGCFTVFSWRLVDLQVTKHEEYAAMAAKKHVTKQPIHAHRGMIQDVHGEVVALDEPCKIIVADGKLIADLQAIAEGKLTPDGRVIETPEPGRVPSPKGGTRPINTPAMIAAEIADLLEMKPAAVEEKITTTRRYVVLKREVKDSVAREMMSRLAAKGMEGIFTEMDARRIYPNTEMLCHVLGYVDGEYKGARGVEASMDRYLSGQDGFRYIERDRKGRELVPYRGQERPARNGYNVLLTVDMGLQNIVETELSAVCAQYRPAMATIIMMEPKTGRILALASRPVFDPNLSAKFPLDLRGNPAVMNALEPGSIFKIVATAGALNEQLVSLDTIINCEGGRFSYANRILKDHGDGPHPDLSVADILVKSSNVGMAKLGLRLGEQRLYEYIRGFGFGERSGVNLPLESPGILHPPHRWDKLSVTRIPMGQGVSVTPLQMTTAMCAIANGGSLMLPQIISEVVDEDGNQIVNFPPVQVRQVVSREAADEVRGALVDVVSERGTAKQAKVPGYTVAGKTGTAQKPDPAGGYYANRYVTSFLGMLPAKDPAFVCLVMLDDPKASEHNLYGGMLAAPTFARIAGQAAQYLNIMPEPEAPPLDTKQGIKLTRVEP